MAICQTHKPSETHLESVTEKGDRSVVRQPQVWVVRKNGGQSRSLKALFFVVRKLFDLDVETTLNIRNSSWLVGKTGAGCSSLCKEARVLFPVCLVATH